MSLLVHKKEHVNLDQRTLSSAHGRRGDRTHTLICQAVLVAGNQALR